MENTAEAAFTLEQFHILQPGKYLVKPVRTPGRIESKHLDLIVPEFARQDTAMARVFGLPSDNPLKLALGEIVFFDLKYGSYRLGEATTKFQNHPGIPIVIEKVKYWLVDQTDLQMKASKEPL